jgi:hypothetical protein
MLVKILGENINAIKQNTEAVLYTGKEIGLEVNTEKAMDMFVSQHQKVGSKSLKSVAKFIHLGTCNKITLTKKLKSRLN